MPVDRELAVRVIARRKEVLEGERQRPSGELDVREGGRYVERKLNAVRSYLYAFTKALEGKFPGLGYLETHAGPGITEIRGSGRLLLGTPLLALTNLPSFTNLRFIELNNSRKQALEARLQRWAVPGLVYSVFRGNCNELIDSVMSLYPPTWPTLVLMDPEGLDLDWSTIVRAGRHPKSELMVIYPYGMAIQRVKGMEDKSAGITRLYGHDRWKTIVEDLNAERISPGMAKKRFLVMFREQLQGAGFAHTVVSEEITSDDGLPLYFLIHASRVPLAARIGQDIFGQKGSQETLPFGPPSSS